MLWRLLFNFMDVCSSSALSHHFLSPCHTLPAAWQIAYEVFLSHKRSDAKDFARALYNLMVLRGISTFLDFGACAWRSHHTGVLTWILYSTTPS